MAHCIVKEAEDILDKEFPVLDHGFIRLVDYLGSDQRIVQSARVSYGEGTKAVRQDQGLINYLMRNNHTSPFEQVNFTFHVKMPIFVARQWIRHRTGRVNEISGRYSIMADEFYTPDEEHVNFQSDNNRQGRSTKEVPAEIKKEFYSIIKEDQERVSSNYHKMLDLDLARELSRIDLPLSLYTQWYWQMDLHNLFHFLSLRLDEHAQYEIRVYAQIILEMVRKVCPYATEAFENYKINSKTFDKKEVEAIKALKEGRDIPLKGRSLELFEQKLN